MNKKLFVLIILLGFLSSIVWAQTSTNKTLNENANNQTNSSFKQLINIDKEILKDPTPKIDERLDNDIKIPSAIQMIAQITFGVKGNISVSALILLLSIWTWVLLLLGGITPMIPFFKNKIMAWLGALIINLVIALSGTYVTIAQIILNIGKEIKFLKDWSTGFLFFCVIIIIVLFYLFKKISKKIQERMKISEAKEEGQNVGISLVKSTAQFDATTKFGKLFNKLLKI